MGRCTAATGLLDTERHMPRAGRASASRTAARAEHWQQERRTKELKERSTAVRMFRAELRELRRTAERLAHHRARHRMGLEHCSARRTAMRAERQVLHMAAEKTHKVAVHRIVVADTVRVVAAFHMDTRHPTE